MWSLGAADYSPQQIRSALRYVMGVDTQLIRDGTYFVLIAGTRMIGAGGWSFRRLLHGGDLVKASGDDELLDPTRDAARVRAFFVDPRFSRRGIGRMLMSRCESAALSAGFHRMELVATLVGERLYEACGFEVLERLEPTLPDGTIVPVVRMGKLLRPDSVR